MGIEAVRRSSWEEGSEIKNQKVLGIISPVDLFSSCSVHDNTQENGQCIWPQAWSAQLVGFPYLGERKREDGGVCLRTLLLLLLNIFQNIS